MQVLVNTACLRAFCFCVLIGTNALESFNGSIAARVSKRSDFFISHVGRAQLALLKRCYSGGYHAVARHLRNACNLAPLTASSEEATGAQLRNSFTTTKSRPVWDKAAVERAGEVKLKRRCAGSKERTKDGALLKGAHLTHCEELERGATVGGASKTPAGTVPGGAGRKRRRNDLDANETSSYDRTGSSWAKNLRESTVEPAHAGANGANKRRKNACSKCREIGVPVNWLLSANHGRASDAKCKTTREAWANASPGTSPTTPLSSAAPTTAGRTTASATGGTMDGAVAGGHERGRPKGLVVGPAPMGGKRKAGAGAAAAGKGRAGAGPRANDYAYR